MPPQKYQWWRLDAVGAAVCVGVALIMYLGAARPMIARHEAAAARQADLNADRSRLRKLEGEVAALRGKLESVRQTLASSPVRLEPASAINRRLADISSLASDNGLKVNGIEPGPAETGAYYTTVPIHLSGAGSYRACTIFLNKLRKKMPDTGVSSLELTGGAGKDGAGIPPANHYGGVPSAGMFRFALLWQAAPGSPPQ